MKIISGAITLTELTALAAKTFGDMIKAVVDVNKEIVALDAELHSDLEALLLEQGSKQQDLWGINIYPQLQGDDLIEFDSLINIRPSQGNKTRSIENMLVREQIIAIIKHRIT